MDLLSQVELAGGWRDAWLHEERGRGGRWVRGLTEQLAGSKADPEVTSQLKKIKDDADSSFDYGTSGLVDAASASYAKGDGDKAATTLRMAAASFGVEPGMKQRLRDLADKISPLPALPGTGQRVDIDQVWQSLGNLASDAHQLGADDIGDMITDAQSSLHGGTPSAYAEAARTLDQAQRLASGAQLDALAVGIGRQARLVRKADPGDNAASPGPAARKFLADKAAPALQKILGGKQNWDGKVQIVSRADWPFTYGEMTWARGMRLREDIAAQIADDQAHPDARVHDPHAYDVVLHELIHGVGDDPADKDMDAYQDERQAAIEEGFTELGATQHMAEFADLVGIGNRHAPATGQMKTHYKVPKAETRPVLASMSSLHNLDTATPAELNALDHASTAVERGDLDSALDYIDSAFDAYATSPDTKLALRSIQEQLNDLADKYVADSRPTVHQVAQVRAQPRAYNDSSGPWGHYPWQTRAAEAWVNTIAHDEGLEGDAARMPRMIELADEINREGTYSKPRVMAEQVARTVDHLDPSKMTPDEWDSIIQNIVEGFSPEVSAASAGDPVAGAKHSAVVIAQKQMEREREAAA